MVLFSDEELTTFCYRQFRPVYEEFATGMSRTQKVQIARGALRTLRGNGEVAGGDQAGKSLSIRSISRAFAKRSHVIAFIAVMF